jgi:hypothetical protein
MFNVFKNNRDLYNITLLVIYINCVKVLIKTINNTNIF